MWALQVLFLLLCSAILAVSSFDEGDFCTLTNGSPGICTEMNSCAPVLDELLAGKMPDKLCGYIGFEPVVCCPTIAPTTPTTTTTTTTMKTTTTTTTTTTQIPPTPPTSLRSPSGVISRQKCAEYARYVFTLVDSAVPNRPKIEVSQCAIRSQKLVVGGTRAERMEFPHMAAVGFNKDGGISWSCGGTLISDIFVLTAAHCTHTTMGNAAWVRVGDLILERTDDRAEPQERRIIERIRHPEYRPPSQYHDIALLRLESPVSFNGWIRPACLHTAPSTGTENAIATGWGLVEWLGNEGSNHLLKVTLPIVDQQTCQRSYRPGLDDKLRNGINGTLSICAGETERDTCQGDSGGPLVIFSKPEYYCMYDVVGVTSLGKMCGSGIPGVYTRVYNYLPWIESKVWGNSMS